VRDHDIDELAGQLVNVERLADSLEGAIEEGAAHHRRVEKPSFRLRDAHHSQRGQLRIGGPHRLYGDHRVDLIALTGLQGQDRGALAIRQGRAEQALKRRGGRGGVGNQAAELNAEQRVPRVRENICRIAIMLDDPPGLVDPQQQGRG
jgi:hypothetical protein